MILAGDIALTVALVAELVFVATYGLTAMWWRSPVGVHLMTEGLMFLGALGYLFVAMWIRTAPPNPESPRLIVFSLLALFTIWRWVILVREQRPSSMSAPEG